MKKRITLFLLLMLSFTTLSAKAEKVKVIEVVGSNTVKVYHNFQTKYVKLAGVDIAPSVSKKKSAIYSSRNGIQSKKTNEFGQEAKAKLKQFIKPGDIIEVEFEKNPPKHKGDTAYFYNKEGEMINKQMLEGGYGNVTEGESKYKDELTESYERAKKYEMGLWEENNKE